MTRQRGRRTRVSRGRAPAGRPPAGRGQSLLFGRPGWWAIAAVVAVAVVAVIVVGVVGALTQSGPEEPPMVTPSEAKVKGPATAPVKIVEYADFQCLHCGNFARTTGRLIDRDYILTGKVRLEFRHYAVLGEESVLAAEAAECANDQGKFWDYHDMLFANQSGVDRGAFRYDRLRQFATEVELYLPDFDACLDEHKYKGEVLRQQEEGAQLGVKGTPYFFINNRVISGNQPYEKFRQIIEAELAKEP